MERKRDGRVKGDIHTDRTCEYLRVEGLKSSGARYKVVPTTPVVAASPAWSMAEWGTSMLLCCVCVCVRVCEEE